MPHIPYDSPLGIFFVMHKKTREIRRVLDTLIPKKYMGKQGVKKELLVLDRQREQLQQPLLRDVKVEGGDTWMFGEYLWLRPNVGTILIAQFPDMGQKSFPLEQIAEAAVFAKTGKGKLLRVTTQVVGDWTTDLLTGGVDTVDERGVMADQPERAKAVEDYRKAKKAAKRQGLPAPKNPFGKK